jgi:hypothetical protein
MTSQRLEELSEGIFPKIERMLDKECTDGVIVIKKNALQGRSEELIQGITTYIESKGYSVLPKEDSQEYHLSYIKKPL